MSSLIFCLALIAITMVLIVSNHSYDVKAFLAVCELCDGEVTYIYKSILGFSYEVILQDGSEVICHSDTDYHKHIGDSAVVCKHEDTVYLIDEFLKNEDYIKIINERCMEETNNE